MKLADAIKLRDDAVKKIDFLAAQLKNNAGNTEASNYIQYCIIDIEMLSSEAVKLTTVIEKAFAECDTRRSISLQAAFTQQEKLRIQEKVLKKCRNKLSYTGRKRQVFGVLYDEINRDVEDHSEIRFVDRLDRGNIARRLERVSTQLGALKVDINQALSIYEVEIDIASRCLELAAVDIDFSLRKTSLPSDFTNALEDNSVDLSEKMAQAEAMLELD